MAGEVRRLLAVNKYFGDRMEYTVRDSDLRTALDLLERAAGLFEMYDTELDSTMVNKWLAEYRTAKGE